MKLRVVVPPHPLIAHWLTILRDPTTPNPIYVKALEEIGRWLTYEAIRDWLPHKKELINIENTSVEATLIDASIPLLAIPDFPAGLEMLNGARDVLPNPHLCLGGVPQLIESNAGILIFCGQIGDGKDQLEILNKLKIKSIEDRRIRFVTCLASPPGLKKISEAYEGLTIYTTCIDEDVTINGEIRPGIGKFSDRINTRINSSN